MPAEFKFKITGVDEVAAEIRDAVRAGQVRGLEKIALRGQQLVMEAWPVGATGFGAHSVAYLVEGEKSPMVARIFEGAPADVYAAPVEFGSRPHFPPVGALLLWVQKKMGAKNEKEALSIAFAIAKTIAKRGTPAAHMFSGIALKTLEVEAPGLLEVALAQELQSRGMGGNA
jgi:hypothetical protein